MGDHYGPPSTSSSRNHGADSTTKKSSSSVERGYASEKGHHRRDDGAEPKRRGYEVEHRGSRSAQQYPSETALDDWKCLECSTWNYGAKYGCKRCDAPRPYQGNREGGGRYDCDRGSQGSRDDGNDRHRRKRSNEQEGTAAQPEIALDFDEYGRAASKLPKKTKWPPCFETNGSAFVLDARSGMFYESTSQFFYDPKSKLYYGNSQATYFTYNATVKNFEEVQPLDEAVQNDTTSAPILNASDNLTTVQPTQGKSKSISINLKTKALPSSSKSIKLANMDAATKEKPSTAILVRVPKKHAADIDKWSERQVEKLRDAQAAQPAIDAKAVATTPKGEPICVLCRRKFPTIEKLHYHEQVSNLHKENLAKEAATATLVAKSDPSYVDRAQQRRRLYGPEAPILLPTDVLSVVSAGSKSQSDITASVMPPQDNLGESNIGNKMLQKLGWKAGNALGRHQERDGDEPDDAAPLQKPPVAALVRQDWERIESMAFNGGKGNGRSGGGVGSRQYG